MGVPGNEKMFALVKAVAKGNDANERIDALKQLIDIYDQNQKREAFFSESGPSIIFKAAVELKENVEFFTLASQFLSKIFQDSQQNVEPLIKTIVSCMHRPRYFESFGFYKLLYDILQSQAAATAFTRLNGTAFFTKFYYQQVKLRNFQSPFAAAFNPEDLARDEPHEDSGSEATTNRSNLSLDEEAAPRPRSARSLLSGFAQTIFDDEPQDDKNQSREDDLSDELDDPEDRLDDLREEVSADSGEEKARIVRMEDPLMSARPPLPGLPLRPPPIKSKFDLGMEDEVVPSMLKSSRNRAKLNESYDSHVSNTTRQTAQKTQPKLASGGPMCKFTEKPWAKPFFVPVLEVGRIKAVKVDYPVPPREILNIEAQVRDNAFENKMVEIEKAKEGQVHLQEVGLMIGQFIAMSDYPEVTASGLDVVATVKVDKKEQNDFDTSIFTSTNAREFQDIDFTIEKCLEHENLIEQLPQQDKIRFGLLIVFKTIIQYLPHQTKNAYEELGNIIINDVLELRSRKAGFCPVSIHLCSYVFKILTEINIPGFYDKWLTVLDEMYQYAETPLKFFDEVSQKFVTEEDETMKVIEKRAVIIQPHYNLINTLESLRRQFVAGLTVLCSKISTLCQYYKNLSALDDILQTSSTLIDFLRYAKDDTFIKAAVFECIFPSFLKLLELIVEKKIKNRQYFIFISHRILQLANVLIRIIDGTFDQQQMNINAAFLDVFFQNTYQVSPWLKRYGYLILVNGRVIVELSGIFISYKQCVDVFESMRNTYFLFMYNISKLGRKQLFETNYNQSELYFTFSKEDMKRNNILIGQMANLHENNKPLGIDDNFDLKLQINEQPLHPMIQYQVNKDIMYQVTNRQVFQKQQSNIDNQKTASNINIDLSEFFYVVDYDIGVLMQYIFSAQQDVYTSEVNRANYVSCLEALIATLEIPGILQLLTSQQIYKYIVFHYVAFLKFYNSAIETEATFKKVNNYRLAREHLMVIQAFCQVKDTFVRRNIYVTRIVDFLVQQISLESLTKNSMTARLLDSQRKQLSESQTGSKPQKSVSDSSDDKEPEFKLFPMLSVNTTMLNDPNAMLSLNLNKKASAAPTARRFDLQVATENVDSAHGDSSSESSSSFDFAPVAVQQSPIALTLKNPGTKQAESRRPSTQQKQVQNLDLNVKKHLMQEANVTIAAQKAINDAQMPSIPVYFDLDLHETLILVILNLILNPYTGTFDPLYVTQFPGNVGMINIMFILHEHLNHHRNQKVVDKLLSQKFSKSITQLLRLMCYQKFNAENYNLDQFTLIAKGAFGQVYSGNIDIVQETQSKKRATPVVIKLLALSTHINDRCSLHDIFNEIITMEKLQHSQNFCQLLDYGVTKQGYIIVMQKYFCSFRQFRFQLFNDKNVNLHCTNRKRLLPVYGHEESMMKYVRIILFTYISMLEILQQMHNQNIIHFDLKMDNIYINPATILWLALQSSPAVTGNGDFQKELLEKFRNIQHWSQLPYTLTFGDFGESHIFSSDDDKYTPLSKGTEFNKSPEMLQTSSKNMTKKTKGAGPPSDIWSAACSLYEMLTGDFLFFDSDWIRFFLRVTTLNNKAESSRDSFTFGQLDYSGARGIHLIPEKRAMLGNCQPLIDLLEFQLVQDEKKRPTIPQCIDLTKHVLKTYFPASYRYDCFAPFTSAQCNEMFPPNGYNYEILGNLDGLSVLSDIIAPKLLVTTADDSQKGSKLESVQPFQPDGLTDLFENGSTFIGSTQDAESRAGLRRLNIKTIIDCTVELSANVSYDVNLFRPSTKLLRISDKQLSERDFKDLIIALEQLFDAVRCTFVQSGCVLLLDETGHALSACFAVACLMEFHSMYLFQALTHLKRLRPRASLSKPFAQLLQTWHERRTKIGIRLIDLYPGLKLNSQVQMTDPDVYAFINTRVAQANYRCVCGRVFFVLKPRAPSSILVCNCVCSDEYGHTQRKGQVVDCPTTSCRALSNSYSSLFGLRVPKMLWVYAGDGDVISNWRRAATQAALVPSYTAAYDVKLQFRAVDEARAPLYRIPNKDDWRLHYCGVCGAPTHCARMKGDTTELAVVGVFGSK